MIITATDFKSICDEFLSQVKGSTLKSENLISEITSRFNITPRGISKRFKSYYGCTISEKIEQIALPTRDELKDAILSSDNVNDVWNKLKLTQYRRKGLFDKHFGVSNFEKAKAVCLLEAYEVKTFNPSICENKSLVYSQVLGDGSWSKDRKTLRISHGEKQIPYAIWKASLFNKAFPSTKPASNTSICVHTQGHKYSSWYSGKLPEKITDGLNDWKAEILMEELTPFGILLYFLDDAYMNFDMTKQGNNHVSIHVPFGAIAIQKLQDILISYGIHSTTSNKDVKIGTVAGAIMFYKNFIEPFKDEIPSCMNYKTELKI